MMPVAFLGAAAASLIASRALIPLLRRVAMDVPNHRSSHLRPVPRAGGLALMLAAVVTAAVGWFLDFAPFWTVLVGGLACGLVGLADDLFHLSAAVRLVWVLLLAGLVGLVLLTDDRSLAVCPVLLVASAITAYTNAFNFMDGINGISGLNALVSGLWFADLASTYSGPQATSTALILAGASLGFLPFNASRARVFLGDSGSYFLGFSLACLAIHLALAGAPHVAVIAPFSLYLTDTGYTLVRRVLRREKLTSPHREHIYQQWVDGGCTHLAASLLIASSCALLCVLSTVQFDIAGWLDTSVAIMLLVLVAYVKSPVLVARAGSNMRGSR